VSYEYEQQQWQRDHEERVQHERIDHVSMHQLVKSARCATTGTLEAGQHAKRTKQKETSLAWFEDVEIERKDEEEKPNDSDAQAPIHDRGGH